MDDFPASVARFEHLLVKRTQQAILPDTLAVFAPPTLKKRWDYT